MDTKMCVNIWKRNPSDNRLGTVELPNGETITYDYNDAGQIISRTATTQTVEGKSNPVSQVEIVITLMTVIN